MDSIFLFRIFLIKSTFVFAVFLCIANQLTAQSLTDKEVCKLMKAKDIVWLEDFGNDLAAVQMKRGKKWGLFEVYKHWGIEDFEYDELVSAQFDSIGKFENGRFTIVKKKKRYGILQNPFEISNAAKKVECNYDFIKIKSKARREYVLIKEEGKWGLMDWFTGYEIIEPLFDNSKEVPLIWLNDWYIDSHAAVKKKCKADLVIPDAGNGDGVFKYRNANTHKWGMVQYIADEANVLISAKFDSLHFFPFNGMYTAVYQDGKVGFYLAKWSYDEGNELHTVPCIYDDYKRYKADGVPKLAVSKHGKWGWVNWLTGEEESEFEYESPDELPYPHYEQLLYLEY